MRNERLRLPVWTDGKSRKPFVVLVSELEDEFASVHLFGNAEVRHMRMAAADYLALPYHYLEILGPAPRPVPVHPHEPASPDIRPVKDFEDALAIVSYAEVGLGTVRGIP